MTDRPGYDPLSRPNLGESVERALLESPCGPLPPTQPFSGAGIYAIHYQGGFEPYRPISAPGCDTAIYVGKAIPPGARRGGVGLGVDPGVVLFARLSQHARSIDQAQNLRIEDFRCRYLVVEDIWIPLGESLAIRKYRPLWNVGPVDGFGNHAPGSGRREQERSAWDVLHPGRPWADSLRTGREPDNVIGAIRLYFAGVIPPTPPTGDEDEPLPADPESISAPGLGRIDYGLDASDAGGEVGRDLALPEPDDPPS